ncbi:acyl-CoA dehydrogenase family protein [Amycolatopsis lurida]
MNDFPLAPPAHEQRWLDVARELAAGFARTAPERDVTAELPRENLEALHAAGLDAALLPGELGGQDLSYRAYGEIVRAVSAACPATACIWVMHIGAAVGLAQLSAPEMARYYADELIAGRRFANALSEPTGGNRFLFPSQAAEPVDGGYLFSGAKRFASGCEIADHFLVNVLVDGEPAFFGVPRDDTIALNPMWDSMGLRASRSQQLEFKGTLLRREHRCPPADRPRPNHIAAGLAFLSLGLADAALAETIAFARRRTLPPHGTPLADKETVQVKIAEAHVRLEAARAYAEKMTLHADLLDPAFFESSMVAKVLANGAAREIAALGLETAGGNGYVRPSPFERFVRDAWAGHLMALSPEVIHAMLGARLLQEG